MIVPKICLGRHHPPKKTPQLTVNNTPPPRKNFLEYMLPAYKETGTNITSTTAVHKDLTYFLHCEFSAVLD